MLVPWNYHAPPNYPLAAARRAVIQKYVESRGLTPGTPKFDQVVDRHLLRVRNHKECRFDAMIEPRVLELARQGRWPPGIKNRPQKKRKRR